MPTPLERFRAKYKVNPETGCWEWIACRAAHGYARFCYNGETIYGHRFSYQMHIGPIPDGLTIDHLCRIRHCVNPAHLEAVTGWENTLRGLSITSENARKTHCKRGHELTPENTRIRKDRTNRECMECRRADNRNYYARKRKVNRNDP